jgi:hypothetical protein
MWSSEALVHKGLAFTVDGLQGSDKLNGGVAASTSFVGRTRRDMLSPHECGGLVKWWNDRFRPRQRAHREQRASVTATKIDNAALRRLPR